MEVHSDSDKDAKYRRWRSRHVGEFNLALARPEVHERRSSNCRKEIRSAFLQVRYGLEIEGRASGKGKVRKKEIRLNQQQRQELEKTQG